LLVFRVQESDVFSRAKFKGKMKQYPYCNELYLLAVSSPLLLSVRRGASKVIALAEKIGVKKECVGSKKG
jgi:hypothetical protein